MNMVKTQWTHVLLLFQGYKKIISLIRLNLGRSSKEED